MSKLEQTARQTLEALIVAEEFVNRHSEDWYISGQKDLKQIREAITAQREALAKQAEPSQLADATLEPVAWGRIFDGDIIDCICPEEHALNEGDYTVPLYAAPVRTKDHCNPLQDLTDDEILEITKRFALGIAFPVGGATTPEMFARAVIAKFKEKNK